jgi:hypothetical protein
MGDKDKKPCYGKWGAVFICPFHAVDFNKKEGLMTRNKNLALNMHCRMASLYGIYYDREGCYEI